MDYRNFTYLYISNVQRPFLILGPFSTIENCIRVVVFTSNLQAASFYTNTGILFHSTTIVLIPRPKLIDDPYPILRVP
jgi:hypothetical protein